MVTGYESLSAGELRLEYVALQKKEFGVRDELHRRLAGRGEHRTRFDAPIDAVVDGTPWQVWGYGCDADGWVYLIFDDDDDRFIFSMDMHEGIRACLALLERLELERLKNEK